MKRNASALAEREYDLVIVGGGIFGVCAAWDAALRGLSVALVERGDFAHATSANCFKLVHGGLRYLQHADFSRIRESSHERNILLRIAPHLVRPLPVVIPTYGHGLRGKEFLCAGLLAYNLLTFDRNRGIQDPQKRIPFGHVISRQECVELFPGLERKGLTGAVIFYDGQMYSPARLALAFLKSAVRAGAEVANYVEAVGFLQHRGRIYGIQARDVLNGDAFDIRSKVVLNAAGPWAEHLLKLRLGLRLTPGLTFSRDAYFVVGRRFTEKYALAVQARTKDPDAVLSRGHRHLFLVPWRDYTIVGVWHVVYSGEPEGFTVTEEDLRGFLDEINDAYPPLALTLQDISMWNAGLILFGENQRTAGDLSFGKRPQIIDHAKSHQVEGLVTLVGERYTTARGVAEKVIDVVLNKLGKKHLKSATAVTAVYGGQIECFDELVRSVNELRGPALHAESLRPLLHNHGSEYRNVLTYINEDPTWSEPLNGTRTIKAEVIHAVREEMAQTLGDVILRRTDLGTGEHPGATAVRQCAGLMAAELGWSTKRRQEELEKVEAAFPRFSLAGGSG